MSRNPRFRSLAGLCWNVLSLASLLVVALWIRSELAEIRSEISLLKAGPVAVSTLGTGQRAELNSAAHTPGPVVVPDQKSETENLVFKLPQIDEDGLRRLEESASLQTEETYGPFFGELDGYGLQDVEALKAILNEQQVQLSLFGREMIGLPRDQAEAAASKLIDIEKEKNDRLRSVLSPEDFERFEVFNLSRSYKPHVDAILNRMQSRLIPIADATRREVLNAYSKAMLESARSGKPGETDKAVEERVLYNVIKGVSPLLDQRQLDAFTEELSKDS